MRSGRRVIVSPFSGDHISGPGTEKKNLGASVLHFRPISTRNSSDRRSGSVFLSSILLKVPRMAFFRTLAGRSSAARRPKNYSKNSSDSPRPPLSGSRKKKGYFFPLKCCGIYLKHLDKGSPFGLRPRARLSMGKAWPDSWNRIPWACS